MRARVVGVLEILQLLGGEVRARFRPRISVRVLEVLHRVLGTGAHRAGVARPLGQSNHRVWEWNSVREGMNQGSKAQHAGETLLELGFAFLGLVLALGHLGASQLEVALFGSLETRRRHLVCRQHASEGGACRVVHLHLRVAQQLLDLFPGVDGTNGVAKEAAVDNEERPEDQRSAHPRIPVFVCCLGGGGHSFHHADGGLDRAERGAGEASRRGLGHLADLHIRVALGLQRDRAKVDDVSVPRGAAVHDKRGQHVQDGLHGARAGGRVAVARSAARIAEHGLEGLAHPVCALADTSALHDVRDFSDRAPSLPSDIVVGVADGVRARHDEDLGVLDVLHGGELADQRAHHAEPVARLDCVGHVLRALEEARGARREQLKRLRLHVAV
mmetsp:Transcript_20154/g.57448  ORF Transcript_20154/g.57448 Transcript_20154/m.57448 type:complete len:387 (-) Transcript_20154:1475-2635(-)